MTKRDTDELLTEFFKRLDAGPMVPPDVMSKFRADMEILGAEMAKAGAAEMEALTNRVNSYLSRNEVLPFKPDASAVKMLEERERAIQSIYDAFNLSAHKQSRPASEPPEPQ